MKPKQSNIRYIPEIGVVGGASGPETYKFVIVHDGLGSSFVSKQPMDYTGGGRIVGRGEQFYVMCPSCDSIVEYYEKYLPSSLNHCCVDCLSDDDEILPDGLRQAIDTQAPDSHK